MTNAGRWDKAYTQATESAPYGDDTTYGIAAEFLRDCRTVEDWGCGLGWFRRFLPVDCAYLGVDGSRSPFAERIADLESYRSVCEGLLLRHVLEHNPSWRCVLDNALASFTRRMALILFTPLAETETEIARCGQTGVPDLSLPREDLYRRLDAWDVSTLTVGSRTHYGGETVLLVTRREH
jgi:hypothetical protein